ncbi:CRISPR-associated endonuclease Cas2 [Herbivorax sp. ANBcel31]|uniref:CRISPR-associated endonuclease Cas2 n=1 Tax=Herbivorax sp. ANBcel31 TaxID=3069754 RepID=UPI0027B5B8EE|nr:CRISPR-associated endonuclease Cas2 [Herbivorax sp. ANBcel31]MDQ2086776.1 CRISPR-associated endonuclease Cas2 [Herbivorax sp. ANBcel31]
MFVILTYDIEVKRINKVRKLLKKYLVWTQNSVFEGDITEGKLQKCMGEIGRIIDKNNDSVYIYIIKNPKNIVKNKLGKEKALEELIL